MINSELDTIQRLIQEIIHNNGNIDFASLYKKLKTKDKEYFHNIILENKISPIFIEYIKNKNCVDPICNAFYKKCNKQIKRFQIHSLQVINEIRKINSLLVNEGITPIFLKGIALQKAYEDISFRPMVDIDILFRKEDLLRAYEILHKNNFISPNQGQILNKNNINDFCKRFYHINIITKNNISVELHHRVTRHNDFVDCPVSKHFFEDFKSINYFNEKINVPSDKNIIIHSLCHFSINSSFKKLLRTLVDIKRLSFKQDINWKEIILKYEDIKIRKGISLSLELINLNKGRIQGLDMIRDDLKEYFPKKELVQHAQFMLYDTSNINLEENFLERLKNPRYLKSFPKVLFPSKNMLKFRYQILKPEFSLYMKYYNEQILRTSQVISNIFKNNRHFRHTNIVNSWLNKDI